MIFHTKSILFKMSVDRIINACVFLIIVTIVHSSPIEINGESEPLNTPIPILSQTDENSPDGSFSYSFETANHIKQQANGYHRTVLVPRLRSDGSDSGELDTADVIVQTGSYSYIAPDGTIISVTFVADENGFQAFGDHLPTPPPIPDAILHSLQNTPHTQADEQHQLLTSQDNGFLIAPSEIAHNDEKQRKQRSSPSAFLPTLVQ